MVNEPPHYASADPAVELECIDAVRAALGREQFIGYLRGVILTYQWRLGRKFDAQEDNAKTAWYVAKLQEVLDEELS